MKLEVKRVEMICMQWSRPRAGAEGAGIGWGRGEGGSKAKGQGKGFGVREPSGSAILRCILLDNFFNFSRSVPQSNVETVILGP